LFAGQYSFGRAATDKRPGRAGNEPLVFRIGIYPARLISASPLGLRQPLFQLSHSLAGPRVTGACRDGPAIPDARREHVLFDRRTHAEAYPNCDYEWHHAKQFKDNRYFTTRPVHRYKIVEVYPSSALSVRGGAI
jgi:hypothetical protein